MKDINTASKKKIAEYLEHLADITGEKACGDEDSPVWDKLFDFIFSDKISRIIYKRFPDFDPYIPDTSYKEDVCAFIYSFSSYASEGVDGNENNDVIFPSFGEWCECHR